MQKIIHSREYKSVHPIFDEFEQFYSATSCDSLQTSNSLIPITFDRAFESLQGIFNKWGNQNYQFNFIDRQYEKINFPKCESKTVVLAFSGGKDSLAATLKYMECGYKIYLYHLRGLKATTYPDEWKSAQELAQKLNLPLIIEDIKFSGKLEFPEHPLKNIIIANNMLQWCIRNGIGAEIAFGNYESTYLDSTAFYYAGDDCIDMYDAYENIMNEVMPDLIVGIALDNLNDTLETIAKHKEYLPFCQSCLGAHRFREYNRKHVLDKYGVQLMPHRCGVCWKCALEYIYMADHNVLEYNEEYYKHCLDVLKKANKRENKIEFTTIENLWDIYFSYDIKQSKYADILNYGKRKKKVK